MTKKRIVFIAESIDKDDSSCSKCNVALIQNAKNAGFEVIVYHYTRHKKPLLEGIDCREIKEIKFSINYFLSRFQRVIQRNFKVEFHTFLEKIFGFSFTVFNDVNSIKKIVKEVINLNPDLVFTVSKGTSFRPHYALLSFPEIHHKWIANIHDPYPFHYNPRPYNWVEPGYAIKEKYFQAISQKAHHASFPSKLLMEWMGSYFPHFLQTGLVIPHQNANQEIKNVALPNYFDESKFNLLHAGNLMKQRSPEGLIEGFKLFLKRNPIAIVNTKLILLGPATFHAKILEKYCNLIPQIFVLNANVPFEIVYKLQQHVSVNIILESKAEISPFLPGKFPHCVEANKPLLLLAPYYSETKRLLGNDYQYWSEVDDIQKIAASIENLYNQWNIDKESLKLNRPDLIDYCSMKNLKKILDSI